MREHRVECFWLERKIVDVGPLKRSAEALFCGGLYSGTELFRSLIYADHLTGLHGASQIECDATWPAPTIQYCHARREQWGEEGGVGCSRPLSHKRDNCVTIPRRIRSSQCALSF